MSGDIGLGRLCDNNAARDAVHVAVAPVVAGENLRVGERVVLDVDGLAVKCGSSPHIGVVDCFLRFGVKKGEKFYLMLLPGSIKSIRHDWTHPAFIDSKISNEASNSPAKLWLTNYAESIGSDLDELLYRTKDYLEHGDYWCEGSRFDGEYLPDEFWGYYEEFTGTTVDDGSKYSFFSCSC